MVRVVLLLLILLTTVVFADDRIKACIVNNYPNLKPAVFLEKKLAYLLNKKGISVVRGNTSGCNVEFLIGAPLPSQEIRGVKKIICTFVLFPELLPVKKKNFYCIRIFPLPERTIDAFFSKKKLKRVKVAVPISEDMLSIAKSYLPSKYFKIILFKYRPSEIYDKLSKFKYVYIFPDPKVLRLINLLDLLDYGKSKGIIFITGLADLKNYGVDFVQGVSYEKLARDMVKLIYEKPKKKILPCPTEE